MPRRLDTKFEGDVEFAVAFWLRQLKVSTLKGRKVTGRLGLGNVIAGEPSPLVINTSTAVPPSGFQSSEDSDERTCPE